MLRESSGLEGGDLRARFPALFRDLVTAAEPGRAGASGAIGEGTRPHVLAPDGKQGLRWLLDLTGRGLRGRYYSALTVLSLALEAHRIGAHRRLELELDVENELRAWSGDAALREVGHVTMRVLLDTSRRRARRARSAASDRPRARARPRPGPVSGSRSLLVETAAAPLVA